MIPYTHESIRLTGRWDTTSPDVAVTTTTGAYLEFSFEGRMALLLFDVLTNATPYLHLWIQLDGGAMIEAPIDSHLRVMAKEDGVHVCRVIYKGGTENDRRWYAPLTGKVSFRGIATEHPVALAPDNRKIIEYVGDSITEGVLIDTDYLQGYAEPTYDDMKCRCRLDDVCATYAWLTAEKLNLRPIFMGYGAVGVTRTGMGRVPAAPLSYPFNFDASPITHRADCILINHGANDAGRPVELYLEKYAELLDLVRKMNPTATVVSLSAFCGAHHEALGRMIAEYNEKNHCNVHFIDSFGWIPKDPLHPLRDGHRTVAEHLSPLLAEILG